MASAMCGMYNVCAYLPLEAINGRLRLVRTQTHLGHCEDLCTDHHVWEVSLLFEYKSYVHMNTWIHEYMNTWTPRTWRHSNTQVFSTRTQYLYKYLKVNKDFSQVQAHWLWVLDIFSHPVHVVHTQQYLTICIYIFVCKHVHVIIGAYLLWCACMFVWICAMCAQIPDKVLRVRRCTLGGRAVDTGAKEVSYLLVHSATLCKQTVLVLMWQFVCIRLHIQKMLSSLYTRTTDRQESTIDLREWRQIQAAEGSWGREREYAGWRELS